MLCYIVSKVKEKNAMKKIKPNEEIFLRRGEEDEKQQLKLDIIQCSLMYLDNWTSNHSFGNFWHLYWNSRSGASVFFEGKHINLTSKHVYLIPAYTLFSTRLTGPVNHFYVDFTVNSHFENMKKGIYVLPVDFMLEKLSLFRNCRSNMRMTIVNSLVWYYLSLIGEENFTGPDEKKLDPRVARAIAIMEKDLSAADVIGNICRKIAICPAKFYQLFKKETGKTPAQFFTELRLERATNLLSHTNESIDDIARQTGFANRYHFSRRFKEKTENTPAHYRRCSPFSSVAAQHASWIIRYYEEEKIGSPDKEK